MTGRSGNGDAGSVVVRPLSSREDYHRCLALQDQTWGERFAERVPGAVLMGAQKVGGVAAGAFDATQELLGFVFGFNGVREGQLAHWSYMLAVRKDVQGCGLGRRLKAYQREVLLAAGIEVAYWTYDPLAAANAHLNLSRLGARPIEYVPDIYGKDTGSDLHRDLGSDRFLVEWRLRDPRVEAALAQSVALVGEELAGVPVATYAGDDTALERPLPAAPVVLVEIPDDILLVRARSPETARRWRQITRRAFRHYLDCGYLVVGWHRRKDANRGAYVLSQP